MTYEFAFTVADELGSEHPERAVVILGVLKHRLNATEVGPLVLLAHDTEQVADACSTVGDER